jgi:hypothetical protein
VFLCERAWPVVKGVAEWIESRVTKTERGYEILHVTGIDEGTTNVNNDAYTNMICKLTLLHANRIAQKLGYPENGQWKNVAENIYIPINKEYQAIEQFEGVKVKDKMSETALMGLFPYGYTHTRQIDENTIRFYIDHGLEDSLVYPMLSGFLGVFPARIGDRQLSRRYFDEGNIPFFTEPYWMSTELSSKFQNWPLDNRITYFITGRGSLMTGLLMGLTRMDIWQEDFENWFTGPIVMPEGWDGIVLEKVYLKGRPARITAKHGDAKIKIEWLD